MRPLFWQEGLFLNELTKFNRIDRMDAVQKTKQIILFHAKTLSNRKVAKKFLYFWVFAPLREKKLNKITRIKSLSAVVPF